MELSKKYGFKENSEGKLEKRYNNQYYIISKLKNGTYYLEVQPLDRNITLVILSTISIEKIEMFWILMTEGM